MKILYCTNFDELHHHKDRRPPWLKIHSNWLDEPEFEILSDTTRLQVILCWLLAARTDNQIPYDKEWIERRISTPVDLETLVATPYFAEGESHEIQHSQQKGTEKDGPTGEIILPMPCRDKGKLGTWFFRQEHLNDFQEAFPEMDIVAVLKINRLWQKTGNKMYSSSGILRHLWNWFRNAYSKGDYPRRIDEQGGLVVQDMSDDDAEMLKRMARDGEIVDTGIPDYQAVEEIS